MMVLDACECLLDDVACTPTQGKYIMRPNNLQINASRNLITARPAAHMPSSKDIELPYKRLFERYSCPPIFSFFAKSAWRYCWKFPPLLHGVYRRQVFSQYFECLDNYCDTWITIIFLPSLFPRTPHLSVEVQRRGTGEGV